jgi:hypothetical protein
LKSFFKKPLQILFTIIFFVCGISDVRAGSCALEFGKLIAQDQSTRVFVQDDFIQKVLGVEQASYVFFGQRSVDAKAFDEAVELLTKGISVETIQKAHKRLTGGKAKLGFRTAGDAKVIGTQSFKGRFALSPAELQAIEANPFLTFVPADDYKKVGPRELDFAVGDIVFPNASDVSKFEDLLSAATLKAARSAKAKPGDDHEVNAAILEDLLTWTLRDAEKQIEAGGKRPEVILSMLEWRIRSLGLYYEPTFEKSGRYLVSDYSSIQQNRSMELAEAIVDAFAEKHGLRGKSQELSRGFRPQLHDPMEKWVAYMGDAIEGQGSRDLSKLMTGIRSIEAGLSGEEQSIFRDYYMTRILTGTRLAGASAEDLLSDFRKFKKIHYSKEIGQTARTLLIPIEFIRQFGEKPQNPAEYLKSFYHLDSTLFRGVSNPRAMKEGDFIDYFKSYKGRQASELSRTVFEEREDLTKLAMLRFNADLIEGRVGYEALQHANKHMSWEAPNSSKTYLVSLTDFDTVAFRFAADKGYVSGSSANKLGTAHFVMETYRPKSGAVDFNEFRKTDPTFRNFFPRQREVAIAGGVDPHSVRRIYELEQYLPSEKPPAVGPEKHARIVRIFERDEKNPMLIWVLEKTDGKNWTRTRSIPLRTK